MTNLYKEQSSNVVKTYLLMAIFVVFISAIGYFFSYYYSSPFLFYFALMISFIMNVASYWYSDKIVLSISKAKPASREEYFDLYTITENLSITAGLPMPKIFVLEDPSPNAFATGRDKDHAVIAVSTGLLKILDRSELEGVVAHELSHIGNRDTLLMTSVVVLVGLISILSDMFLRNMWLGGNNRENNRGGGLLAIIGIILVVLSPLIATLIKLAISRRREFLADSSAALLTRYPEGLANALRKIAGSNIPMKNAHSATAHLFISNPFEGKNISNIFSTHPPVGERIRRLVG